MSINLLTFCRFFLQISGLLCFIKSIYFLIKVKMLICGKVSINDSDLYLVEKQLRNTFLLGIIGGVLLTISIG